MRTSNVAEVSPRRSPVGTSQWKHKGRLAAAALAAVVLVGAGCGDDDDSAATQDGAERGVGDQPAPGTDTFEQGLFDEIPRYRPSEAVGPRNEENDIVTQSFRARDSLPDEILAFYVRQLEAPWQVQDDPQQIGAGGTWRGVWIRDNWRLIVSATRAPALEGEPIEPGAAQGTLHSQYSLTLEPR